MTLFRGTGRHPRPKEGLIPPHMASEWIRPEDLPPRPPEHRRPARPDGYSWANAFSASSLDAGSDPCGAPPEKSKSAPRRTT